MSLLIPGCDLVIPDYNCNTCEIPELGVVRGLALVKKDYVFTDPSNATEWTTAITDGNVLVVPETAGSMDSSPLYGKGYGGQKQRLIGDEYTLNAIAGNYKANCGFWNTVKFANIFKLAFVTESLVHVTDVPVSISPKAPIQDDSNTEVAWNIEFTWTSRYSACPFDKPAGIFDCFTEG